MVESATGALLGLLLGARHALEPDHLAAVSTLTVRTDRCWHCVVLGGLWGIGHTLALLCLGGGLILAERSMPPWLDRMIELLVALVMIIVGGSALRQALRNKADTFLPPVTDRPGCIAPQSRKSASPSYWLRLGSRTLAVGLVHGLGGSGPLMALAAAGLHGALPRILYLALFGAGSVAGMAAMSGLIGWPSVHLRKQPILGRTLSLIVAGTSLLIGLSWLLLALHTLWIGVTYAHETRTQTNHAQSAQASAYSHRTATLGLAAVHGSALVR